MAQRTPAAAENTKRKLQEMRDQINQALTNVDYQSTDDTDLASLDEGVNSWANNIDRWNRQTAEKNRNR
jgi:hypothetical protein